MANQGGPALNQDGVLVLGVGPDGKMYPFSVAVGGASVIGNPDDEPWDGVSANATVISLLKAIAINTTPETP